VNAAATRLLGREVIADRTLAFHFARPAGFAFRAGQTIDLLIDMPADAGAEAGRHTFSVASAPAEDRLTVATRMRDSAFKRALGKLAVGGEARLEGPFGSLTLHGDRSRPALFIAGGIGITPYMSMLRQARLEAAPRRIALLYSNHRPEDSAWLGELQELERGLPEFSLLPVMTATNRSAQAWSGRAGRIDARMLQGILGELPRAVCYVTGSPAMVAGMRTVLSDVGVGDDDVRSEDFFGY
jgi:ferredoxin-NADP reductase